MKAIKVMAIIDEHGQLTLDHPLMTDKNSRVEVIVLIAEAAEIDEDEPSKEVILEDFRQAWHEAMTGQTIPVDQLWEGLEDV
ncbi:type II toxin-antitoxin system RelN family antitoxin [Nostoc sp.]|uniref:type II toxin-antitoxin system RelN family antitoxin n=1 Tax=Nostoc sp. TaxID=1180 RepID=UPI002FF69CAB